MRRMGRGCKEEPNLLGSARKERIGTKETACVRKKKGGPIIESESGLGGKYSLLGGGGGEGGKCFCDVYLQKGRT